jgi:hypothetical protein
MKNALALVLGLMILGGAEVSAGVLGKYNVKGKEGYYTTRGTLTLNSLKSCTVRLKYSDGDSITVTGKLKTALKDTREKQTAKFTWSVYGMSGTGSVTISGITGGYKTTFNYSGSGISGSGSGTKKP